MAARVRFWAYNNGSASVQGLLPKVKGLMLKHEDSKFKWKIGDIIINWGFSRPCGLPVLNKPGCVTVATSKRATFTALAGKVPLPEYTNDKIVATEWYNTGYRVLGRDQDHGKGGHGITVYDKTTAPPSAHLFYVKYVPKQREFRIHVFQGKVIFEQEKLKRNGVEQIPTFNRYVRSHASAWIFAFKHLDVKPVPEIVRTVALQAVAGLGLDFGACDIGFNDKTGPCLYEVNTAPGIEETTLDAYAKAILNA